jgi:hypothetical protein
MTPTTSTQAGSSAQAPAGGGLTFTRKRQLRNFLLDRVQLQYTAIIVLISACLTGGLGYLVVKKAHEASETVRASVLALDDAAMREQIMAGLAAGDRFLLLAIVGFGSVLCVVLALYGIVITHKVAGPLYKIATYFANVRDGQLGPVRSLRKGDQLQDFFEQFRIMHDALRARTQEEIQIMARSIAALEQQAGGPRAELEALRALLQKKEDSLK